MKKLLLIFSLILFASTLKSQNTKFQNLDTLISNVIDDISVDSVRSYIQHLQDYGDRYAGNPNRKEVATWIANKFKSWGYSSELDSFDLQGYMQYNVIATIKGTSDSSVVFVMGGHYDSVQNAPGADDNASGTTAALEVARVLSKNNYIPPFTIKFMAFAAEEVGLWGSQFISNKAKANNENIHLMINNDMISNDPDTTWKLQINGYSGSESFSKLSYYCAEKYTRLIPTILNNNSGSSDSWSFWKNGYNVIYFDEYYFSTVYHQPADTMGNINVAYCTEVIKANAATLIHEIELPHSSIKDIRSNCNEIKLFLNKPKQPVIGYNVYRSLNPDSSFVKINTNPITDTIFVDNNTLNGIDYWYSITSLNNSLNESTLTNAISSTLMCKDKGILIIDDSDGGLLSATDSTIDTYYNNLLQGYTITNYQTTPTEELKLSKLGNYSTIFWHLNNNNYSASASSLKKSSKNIETYLKSGGNFFLTTYKPANYIIQQFIDDNILKSSIAYKYLKIDTIINSSYLNNAIAYTNEFSSIKVDSLKLPSANNGILKEIKSIRPSPEADTLLVSSTYYANNTTYGQYNGNPIAIGYFGEDYKTVTLSFPLYYMDLTQSKVFVDKILHDKFNEVVGIKEIEQKKDAGFIMQLYPNPCVNDLYVRYNLKKQSIVSLEIFNSNGIKVFETNSQTKSVGENYQWIYNLNLTDGLYIIVLKTNDFIDSQKFIIKK